MITLQIGILHAHVPHLGRPPSFMPTSRRRWFCPRGSGVEAWLDMPREDSDQEALPAAIAGVEGYDMIGGRLLQICGRALQIGSPYRPRVDESAPNLASRRSDRSRRRCSLQPIRCSTERGAVQCAAVGPAGPWLFLARCGPALGSTRGVLLRLCGGCRNFSAAG
jgi:hypothetical protein